jgi:hypothetical protein
MDRNSYGKVCLYQDELIPCQSYHDDYAYPVGRVAMSVDDGTTFSTQVSGVRCMWVTMTVNCCAKYLMSSLSENSAPLVLIQCRKPPGVAHRSSGIS